MGCCRSAKAQAGLALRQLVYEMYADVDADFVDMWQNELRAELSTFSFVAGDVAASQDLVTASSNHVHVSVQATLDECLVRLGKCQKVMRQLQSERKKLGFAPQDWVTLTYGKVDLLGELVADDECRGMLSERLKVRESEQGVGTHQMHAAGQKLSFGLRKTDE